MPIQHNLTLLQTPKLAELLLQLSLCGVQTQAKHSQTLIRLWFLPVSVMASPIRHWGAGVTAFLSWTQTYQYFTLILSTTLGALSWLLDLSLLGGSDLDLDLDLQNKMPQMFDICFIFSEYMSSYSKHHVTWGYPLGLVSLLDFSNLTSKQKLLSCNLQVT